MENRNNAKPVVDAGMMVALTLVLTMLIRFLPFLGIVGFLVFPIPIAILYIRYDLKLAVNSLIIATVMSSIILGIVDGISLTGLYALIGLGLGYCFKNNVKQSKALFILSIFTLIAFMLRISLYVIFIDRNLLIDIINQLIDSIKSSFQQSMNLGGAAANGDQLNFFRDQINNLSPTTILTWAPAALVIYSFISASVNYVISRIVLRRLNFKVGDLVPFDKVYIDNRIGAVLIILLCLGIVAGQRNMLIGDYLVNSAGLVLNFTFIIIGSALVYYFLKNKIKMNKNTAAFITIAAIFMPTSSLVFYLGLADMLFDFRKVDPNRLFKGRAK